MGKPKILYTNFVLVVAWGGMAVYCSQNELSTLAVMSVFMMVFNAVVFATGKVDSK